MHNQNATNHNATHLIRETRLNAASLNVRLDSVEGATLLDFGCGRRAETNGGLAAGIRLAELCLGGMGQVSLTSGRSAVWRGPDVMVATDQPLRACMGSQYAGWSMSCDYISPTNGKTKNYFAMASGPMRAARGKEKVLEEYSLTEQPDEVVGVLETRKKPPIEAIQKVAEECGVEIEGVNLAYAPTASVAGSVQIAARCLETALHKLHELGFDLRRVHNGIGVAPLAPIAKNDTDAIGRTNDAVLYGGEVTLWVTGDDDSLRDVGQRTPSSASRDFGEPFGDVFRRYEFDFYKVDPLLFSPAVVNFCNLESGSYLSFGELRPDVLHKSFHN